MALPVPSASLPELDHGRMTITKQMDSGFWTLTVASCYQTLVTSTSAGTTQGASVYLTENARYFRASEHLGALTHDPGT